MSRIVLRMDDVGASTKHFEVYSKKIFGNFLFLKYLPYFRAWGVYEEIGGDEWSEIIEFLDKHDAKMTVGITASWVEKDGSMTPFPEKYPEQSDILKEAHNLGVIEIANHGLTHCVVGKHLPKLFSSNRKFHREFWDWLPQSEHDFHVATSQSIFKEWLGYPCDILIPPGNVYSMKTVKACQENGISAINSSIDLEQNHNIRYLEDKNVDAFHDREIVLYGKSWLFDKIKKYKEMETSFCFLKEL